MRHTLIREASAIDEFAGKRFIVHPELVLTAAMLSAPSI